MRKIFLEILLAPGIIIKIVNIPEKWCNNFKYLYLYKLACMNVKSQSINQANVRDISGSPLLSPLLKVTKVPKNMI